jgi:TolB-like protein
MGKDEAGTLERLKALLADLVQPSITKRKGRVVKLMGDGLLAEFRSVVEAVQCAVDIQTAMTGRETDLPEAERIKLKIGVNLGDLIAEGADIYGDGVNVAARLEGLAGPGEIFISGKVYDEVMSRVEATFEDLGEQKVKNIENPVRVFRWGGSTPTRRTRTTRGIDSLVLPEKPSIAVLLFTNVSGNPEQDYFAEGLTEDVIAQLSRFRSLFVIHSTSTLTYKGQMPRVQDVGRDLGVAYVAMGSVRKAGNRVRIMITLVQAESGRQLWTERFDGDLEDIFAVQDEVASKVVSTLVGHIDDTERHRAARKHVDDLEAFELVLLGEQAMREFTRDGVFRARELLCQALERDPANARAHSAMARTYLDELWSDWSLDWNVAATQAYDWARKAVALDELDNRARVNLGVAYYHCKGNFDAAQDQFAKALELNPNDADAFCLRGRCYVYAGEADQALACTDRSKRLTPFDSNECNIGQFLAHYTARRYTDALSSLGRIVNPTYRIAAYLAACYAQLGRDVEARAAMEAYMAKAQEEITIWPAQDPKAWRQHWAQSQPFRKPADFEHLLDGFRKAGMPA